MQSCEQTNGQSIYDHGLDVWRNFELIYECIKNNSPSDEVKIPDWVFQHRELILDNLLPLDIIREYLTFHDCGKPFCFRRDEAGKVHFPDHEKHSFTTWTQISDGSERSRKIGQLILHDMDIHRLRPEGVEEFSSNPDAITLLISGIAAINSNAKMFGGFESDSFKIKYKRISKLGKRILEHAERSIV
jgi:hypothetical protein